MALSLDIEKICRDAKQNAPKLAESLTSERNRLLIAISGALRAASDEILEANSIDMTAAEGIIPEAMLDRLKLTPERISGICESLCELASLPDPIGNGKRTVRPNGLVISCIQVPLGVVGMIYESRPNVTVDAAALCLKTGNAVVLRGGREAINTNRCLVSVMRGAVEACGFSPALIGFIDSPEREGANILMAIRGLLDVLIPRGGKGLIKSVTENSRVPVIETGAGNCHLYIDDTADIDMAVNITINAKCSRPSVCNAIETLLVHSDIAENFLPAFDVALRGKYTLELRGDEKTRKILPRALEATDEDYATEYDDFILSVRIVDSLDTAIEHINRYSTGHSEAIVTNSLANADRFRREVNSACVYVNASTRFTDGGEFGFGAEIGISTQKLHARGPMGLEALTTKKYLIDGNGQIR